jgi:hypothetical protein
VPAPPPRRFAILPRLARRWSAPTAASLLACALSASVAPFAHAAREADPHATPEGAARAFYQRVTPMRIAGLPGARQQRELAPLLSTALSRALREAAEAERRRERAKARPGDRAPRGNPFTSLAEGAREASVERCFAEGDHAQCPVSLSFRDAFGATQRWQDRAVLVREKGRWLIDDIAYEARWPYANKGTLSRTLKAIAGSAP